MNAAQWRVPGYTVERLIGVGASAEVWRGRVNATGAPVALKRIDLAERSQRQAALSEAALLATLEHPHLVRIYDVRHLDDAIVLVLDLATGGSMADLLGSRGRLTPGEVITALAPIAAALAYAHGAGVVHGDVTPGNVLFTEIGLPLLADLGVARLLGENAPAFSTPAYIDPAVAAGYLPGPASDVFMLGGVALHALTGEPVWTGASVEEVLVVASSTEIGDVAGRLAAAHVPKTIAEVVCRALALEAERRGTAADFALDLRHAGQPVAVALSAGHSAVKPSTGASGIPAAGRHSASSVAGEPTFTHGARLPSPVTPVERRRRVRTGLGVRGRWRGTRWGGAAALASVLAVAAVVAVRWPLGTPAHRRTAVSSSVEATSTAPSQPESVGPTSTRPAASSRPPISGLDASAARQWLSGLDATRASAFARRDLDLLGQVYVPGALLAQDTALLTSIVPVGCGLHGAHTGYREVAVLSRHGATVEIRARATLAESSLICAGTVTGRAPGAGPALLRIVLVRQADGYRIAAQRTS